MGFLKLPELYHSVIVIAVYEKDMNHDYNFQSVNSYLVVIHNRNSTVPVILVMRNQKPLSLKTRLQHFENKNNCEVSHLYFCYLLHFSETYVNN